jgi:hypothetical protein
MVLSYAVTRKQALFLSAHDSLYLTSSEILCLQLLPLRVILFLYFVALGMSELTYYPLEVLPVSLLVTVITSACSTGNADRRESQASPLFLLANQIFRLISLINSS